MARGRPTVLGVTAMGSALSSVVACGPTVDEPLVRLATCGTEGPVRLLEPPDTAAWSMVVSGQTDDRILVWVEPFGDDLAEPERNAHGQTWSVGPCGEAPTQIATGLYLYPQQDGLFGCRDPVYHDGTILRVDLAGRADPVVVLPAVDCLFTRTEHGWLGVDADGALLLHRDPSRDDLEAETLATGVRQLPSACGLNPGPCEPQTTAGPVVFVVTDADALLRIDLVDRTQAVVETDVAWAWLEPSGTTLWWRERAIPDTEEPHALAPVHRRELDTGDDRVIYDGTAPNQRQWPYGLVELRDASSPYLLDFRDQSLHELPSDIASIGTRAGGPVLLWSRRRGPLVSSYVWSTAEERAIEVTPYPFCDARTSRRWGAESFDIVVTETCEQPSGDLWSYPYDGGEPSLLVRNMSTPSSFLPLDDRVVWSEQSTQLPSLPYPVGSLWVTDDDPDEHLRLDDRAHLFSRSWAVVDGDVLYTVHDGDRTGVWRTATR